MADYITGLRSDSLQIAHSVDGWTMMVEAITRKSGRRLEFDCLADLIEQEIGRWRILARSISKDMHDADRILEGFLIEIHMRMAGLEAPYLVEEMSTRLIAYLRRQFQDQVVEVYASGSRQDSDIEAITFSLFAAYAIEYLSGDTSGNELPFR